MDTNDILKDKVAIITGASRGIGAATALEFARNGTMLVLGYQNESSAWQKTDEELGKITKKYLWCKGDIALEPTARMLCDCAMQKWGRIDIVVANAGISHIGPFSKISNETLMRIISVNQNGTYYLLREAGNIMKKARRGVVVTVSSSLVTKLTKMYSVYAATKAYVEILTKAFALEYADYGIRANVVAPGVTNTDMNRISIASSIGTLKETNLLKGIADPIQIAKVITFLCSDEASFINAQTICVDGGMIKGI